MMIRRRQWHPTPVLLPGKSHGQRRLVGCSPWGRGVGQSFWNKFHQSFYCMESSSKQILNMESCKSEIISPIWESKESTLTGCIQRLHKIWVRYSDVKTSGGRTWEEKEPSSYPRADSQSVKQQRFLESHRSLDPKLCKKVRVLPSKYLKPVIN